MIIQLTADDWWQEFIFWRNHGQKKIAFDYLRTTQDPEYFDMLVALIAIRKYGSEVKPGDLICLGDIKVIWSQEVDDKLHSESICKPLRQIFHAAGGSVY
jgi:hypothetical protein